MAAAAVAALRADPLYTAYAHPTVGDQQGAGLVMGAEEFLTMGTFVTLLRVSLWHTPARAPNLEPDTSTVPG